MDFDFDDSSEKATTSKHKPDPSKNKQFLKREIHYTIETPSGERIPMRFKPEMTVENLLGMVCKKSGIDPVDHYAVFDNREMRLKSPMKNFNVNQNSVVKIYKSRKLEVTPDIFVSVRVRDCRIGSVFRPTDNIWDILNMLLSENSYEEEMVPIVVYQKQEFIGEKVLQEIRLRDLGVNEGSCILRFLQLKQEDLDQRKMRDDDDTLMTLESLEMKAAGPTADSGARSVHFRLSESEVDPENVQFIGERRAIAFRLLDNDTFEDKIQEEYFDLMPEEIQALITEVTNSKGTSSRNEITEGVREQLVKLRDIRLDFDDTLIRIEFPDRTCLQCMFLPEERISDVKDFLRKFLKIPTENFLLTTSTNTNIEDHMTLAQLKLVPTARFIYEPLDRPSSNFDQYLQDEVASNLAPFSVGKDVGMMLRGESLDKFLMSSDDRNSFTRKSSGGGFMSRFIRSSRSSSTKARAMEGSRSYSKHYGSNFAKKQSYFVPKGKMDDEDDDDDEPRGSQQINQSTRQNNDRNESTASER